MENISYRGLLGVSLLRFLQEMQDRVNSLELANLNNSGGLWVVGVGPS